MVDSLNTFNLLNEPSLPSLDEANPQRMTSENKLPKPLKLLSRAAQEKAKTISIFDEPGPVVNYGADAVNPFSSAEDFEKYCLRTYSQRAGNKYQEILNLGNLYNKITSMPPKEQESLFRLLRDGGGFKLESRTFVLKGTEEKLIKTMHSAGVSVPGGGLSEFWFAILFNGVCKGGLGLGKVDTEGKSGIVADVIVDHDQKVSLKAYERLDSVDLGAVSYKKIADTISLYTVLSGANLLEGSVTNKYVNNKLLPFFKDAKNIKDLKAFQSLCRDNNIAVLQRLGSQLEAILGHMEIDKAGEALLETINAAIREKIFTVDWWGLYHIPSRKLYLESSENFYEALKSINTLNPAITNFHRQTLRINFRIVLSTLGKL